MSMSTPLDQILAGEPSAAPPADEERVKRILATMNASAEPPALAQQSQQPRVITEPPLSVSTGQIRMDPDTARANVIGGSIPTMADFQSMFQQASPGMAPYHGPAVVPGAMVPTPAAKTISGGGWKSMVRGPVAVAIIVFFLNMPVVTSILSRYASWMYLSSGEISIGGLFSKALLAAVLFGLYQVGSSFMGEK